jgi:hypothetical protein
MALRFLLDENQRGVLWHVIQRHNARGLKPLDAVRVGDPPDLPLGIADPGLLRWTERQGRILVSFDKSTLPAHLAHHLALGCSCPGIILVSRAMPAPALLEYLVLAAYASDPSEWINVIRYLP